MRKTLDYDLTLITGATSGLGKALAFLLAEEGVPLFLTGRDSKALLDLQKELPPKTQILAVDLSSSKDLETLIQKLQESPPDLVINNAGFGLYGDILSYPIEKQMDLLKVNGEVPIHLSIECARMLKKAGKKGTIMNISSTASGFIYPGFTLYAASKTLLKEFSLSFDREMRKEGIRILTSLPGRFHSPFREKAAGQKISPSSLTTISLEKTAKLILKQIEKQKGIEVIDFRYKLIRALFFLFPKSLLSHFLRKK